MSTQKKQNRIIVINGDSYLIQDNLTAAETVAFLNILSGLTPLEMSYLPMQGRRYDYRVTHMKAAPMEVSLTVSSTEILTHEEYQQVERAAKEVEA